MKFRPGTVASLDLSRIGDQVMVTARATSRYPFDECRPYLCERVEGDVSIWLALTTRPDPDGSHKIHLMSDRMCSVQDPWTTLEIPNHLITGASRPHWMAPRVLPNTDAVLAELAEYRATSKRPKLVRRRATDLPEEAS